MSDFDRFIEQPHGASEPPSIVSQSPEPGVDSHSVPMSEIRSLDHLDSDTPMKSPEVGDPRHAQAEAVRREIGTREETIDARVTQLVAEIKSLTSEPRHADRPAHGHEGPLEGVRRYCQGVMDAIGGFFGAVFGQSEPKLDRPDAKTAEIARKIGIDVEELKSLQDTRRAYEELDRRIASLEGSATPEQQHAIAQTADNLDLHSRTREWLESLLKTLENRPAPADAAGEVVAPVAPDGPSGSVGPVGPVRPIETSPWEEPLPIAPVPSPSQWSPIEPAHTEAPLPQPPDSIPQDTPPWRPGVPAHQDTPLNPPGVSPWLPPANPTHNEVPSVSPVNPTPWRESPIAPEPHRGPPEGTSELGDQNEALDDALVHQQGLNDLHDVGTCGVVTQEMILNRLSGTHNYTERSLTNEAQSHGWFVPNGGTPLNQVGNLCEAHGLHVEHRLSNLKDLAEHLEKGDQAIVAVNAGKLGGAWALDPHSYGDGSANHAVWVSGMRVETHNGISTVIAIKIHDSGVGKSYELTPEQFEQAWSASNDSAVYVSPGIVSRGAQLS